MPNRVKNKVLCRELITLLPVVIFLIALSPVWAQEDVTLEYETLLQQFNEAEQNGDYPKALEITKKMEELTWPRHIEVLYNKARLYSLTGDRSKAYEYLYWATDSGYWDFMKMRDDSAFESMRNEELFKTLTRKAWSNGYIYMLERDEREEFQKKEEILEALELKPGDFIADVGAGSGYFTIPIAKAVGTKGKVLATDIRQVMLDYIGRRLKIEKLENVELLLAEPDDPMLPAGKVDLILMVDVYHYIKERTAFGEKLRTGLAPDGRLVVIDYIPKPWEERPWGPPPQQHLSKDELNADLEKAGFEVIEDYDFLPEQFFVVYKAK